MTKSTNAVDVSGAHVFAEWIHIFSTMPELLNALSAQRQEIAELKTAIHTLVKSRQPAKFHGWVDAKGARKYLGGMSASTFDKYRYGTTVKLKGHRVGGKIYYKIVDLDNFMLLYDVAPNTLA